MKKPVFSFPSALLVVLSLLIPWQQAGALELKEIHYDRAFSPNGDGEQDENWISFLAEGDIIGAESEDPDTLRVERVQVGIYEDATVPPDPGALLATLIDSLVVHDPDSNSLIDTFEVAWDGRDDLDLPLADGYYYLHIYAQAGDLTAILDPAIQLQIDTVAPTFHSVAITPSPYYTPLALGADSLAQLFFSSADFDTLHDSALATILMKDPGTGAYDEVDLLVRDGGFIRIVDGIPQYRFVWNGRNAENERVDGEYRADLIIEDEAGNAPDYASLYIDLDIEAPSLSVQRFGEGGKGQRTFHFPPDAIPDSLFIYCVERNGTDFCRIDWNLTAQEEQERIEWIDGTFLSSMGDTSLFLFETPVDTYYDGYYNYPDTTIALRRPVIDAGDFPGNTGLFLGQTQNLSINLDDTPPPVPIWDVTQTHRIQRLATLFGHTEWDDDEFPFDIHLYEDGEFKTTMGVSPEFGFSFFVLLNEGSHEFTAISEDESGNLSASSEVLTITYSPGPAVNMPGRFRGRVEERFEVNTDVDAQLVTARIYTIEGELVRLLESIGGPREFFITWDLKDQEGRDLLDGLYIVNICTTLSSGKLEYLRKVVAIVRD